MSSGSEVSGWTRQSGCRPSERKPLYWLGAKQRLPPPASHCLRVRRRPAAKYYYKAYVRCRGGGTPVTRYRGIRPVIAHTDARALGLPLATPFTPAGPSAPSRVWASLDKAVRTKWSSETRLPRRRGRGRASHSTG
eukprot:scaffold90540_cov69-Phaeocystis_antarctica.AAC.4